MTRMVSRAGAAAICLVILVSAARLTGQNSETSVHADLQDYMAAQTAAASS